MSGIPQYPLRTRAEAVELVIGQGLTYAEAADIVGVSSSTICSWVNKYRGCLRAPQQKRSSKLNDFNNLGDSESDIG